MIALTTSIAILTLVVALAGLQISTELRIIARKLENLSKKDTSK